MSTDLGGDPHRGDNTQVFGDLGDPHRGDTAQGGVGGEVELDRAWHPVAALGGEICTLQDGNC